MKTTRRLYFVWVEGHATKVHIDREITTTLDKQGNDAADALASAAAAPHEAPQALAEAATKRQRVAVSTHVLVVELFFFIKNDVTPPKHLRACGCFCDLLVLSHFIREILRMCPVPTIIDANFFSQTRR